MSRRTWARASGPLWCQVLIAGLAAAASITAAAGPGQQAPDVLRGEQLYGRCMGCHAPAYDSVGPRHCGLFGRRAGSLPGYAFSAAMKAQPWVWNAATLERFLAAPLAAVPGTSMTYDGIADARERRDLIAYLRALDASPQCRAAIPAKHQE